MRTIPALITVLLAGGMCLPLAAQKKGDKGHIGGSVESAMGFYFDDKKLGTPADQESFGTNTFLNLGYEFRNFRFGIQYEIFEPPMVGFSSEFDGNKLMQGFASYSLPNFELRLGTVFEQVGSGLLFRTYEDRGMMINNSLMGGNVRWRPTDWISLKAFAGVPKKYLKYVSGMVYGVDADLHLGQKFFPKSDISLILGGGWVLRDDHTWIDPDYEAFGQTVRGYSGRLNFSKGIFSLGGEYVFKSKENIYWHGLSNPKGEALLLNMGLDYQGFGLSVDFRTLRYMDFLVNDDFEMQPVSLNYLPALTRQHKYALLSLYPHEVKEGCETGGQFDAFGEIPLGGDRHPLSFSLNGSLYRQLKAGKEEGEFRFLNWGGGLKYAELGLELEHKWNRKLKTILAAAWQKKDEFSNHSGKMLMDTEILVADVLYKFSRKTSLRVELQHAWSDFTDNKAWVYALAELGLAPKWMFYASDLYNYDTPDDKIHYFTVGSSFTWESLRVSASYGRNREGYVCSGGVCRYVPKYSGLTLNLSLVI